MRVFEQYDESTKKQLKRREILEHSMDIFIREGIHPVMMQEIADECSVSLRTLYYYYKNKDELAVDVMMLVFNHNWFSKIDNDSPNLTGYEKLVLFTDSLLNYIQENHKIVKYITAFDHYFHNSYPSTKYTSFLEELLTYTKLHLGSDILDDGTIETFDKDIETTVATVYHSVFAFAQRFIYREKAMLSEESGNRGSIEQHAKILLRGLKK